MTPLGPWTRILQRTTAEEGGFFYTVRSWNAGVTLRVGVSAMDSGRIVGGFRNVREAKAAARRIAETPEAERDALVWALYRCAMDARRIRENVPVHDWLKRLETAGERPGREEGRDDARTEGADQPS